jgi:hypothetical protein
MRDRARLQIDYLCGYEWECISRWAATATAKLQVQHLGDKSVAHTSRSRIRPSISRRRRVLVLRWRWSRYPRECRPKFLQREGLVEERGAGPL